ncbi:MAG: aldehyde ferredoxin oxidoreductase C-terminal domain-containing protein, partial [Deltaproteobacteria bacterium]
QKKGRERSGAVVIGPAGERRVRFSVVENDKWRSAGRTGMGAVMGAKNLKGIVFHGTRTRTPAHPDNLARFVQETKERRKDDKGVHAYKTLGTPMMVDVMNKAGAFPTQYWSKGQFDKRESINAAAMQEKCTVRPHACLRCMMACGKLSTVKSGPHAGLTIEGPEYETLYAFGGLCMIDEIEEIAYLNDLCDRLGMDTITAGNLCAFAIEAARRGKIKDKLEYGDAKQVANLLQRIAAREGVGDILAEGIVPASKAFGLEDLAIHVKGMEPAGYDPRALKGVGLGYAVSDRGACHLRATFYKPELAGISPPNQMEGKVEVFLDFEDRLNIFDTLILCRFYRDLYPWDQLQEIIAVTTGLELNEAELRRLSAHVMDDTRRFNIQEGLTLNDDTLPKRLFKEPLESGEGITEAQLVRMRSDYYRLRGWSREGIPPERDGV